MTSPPVLVAVADSSTGRAVLVGLALGLACAHLFAGRLRLLDRVPRSRWLSGAGGASVAYVFVHLFPELQEGAEAVARSDLLGATAVEQHVYVVALVGFGAFYGLERLLRSTDRNPEEADGLFWLHVGSFAVYNGLIGYALHGRGGTEAWTFALAMGLHFFVNDVGLRDHHHRLYDRVGRWVLAGAVLAGVAAGFAVELSEAMLAVVLAFLAGGVVLNVVKEELPEERESRFWAFAAGAAGYAALLLFG